MSVPTADLLGLQSAELPIATRPHVLQAARASAERRARSNSATKAKWDFVARGPDELNFKKGDLIKYTVAPSGSKLAPEPGWVLARHVPTGHVGLVPENYLEKPLPSAAAARPPPPPPSVAAAALAAKMNAPPKGKVGGWATDVVVVRGTEPQALYSTPWNVRFYGTSARNHHIGDTVAVYVDGVLVMRMVMSDNGAATFADGGRTLSGATLAAAIPALGSSEAWGGEGHAPHTVRYEHVCHELEREQVRYVHCRLFVWARADSLCVSDIDGPVDTRHMKPQTRLHFSTCGGCFTDCLSSPTVTSRTITRSDIGGMFNTTVRQKVGLGHVGASSAHSLSIYERLYVKR